MSEFYDEYTDDEEENITLDLSKTAEKYQKMIDEILENTKDLETSANQLKKTEEVLTKVHQDVKQTSSTPISDVKT